MKSIRTSKVPNSFSNKIGLQMMYHECLAQNILHKVLISQSYKLKHLAYCLKNEKDWERGSSTGLTTDTRAINSVHFRRNQEAHNNEKSKDQLRHEDHTAVTHLKSLISF